MKQPNITWPQITWPQITLCGLAASIPISTALTTGFMGLTVLYWLFKTNWDAKIETFRHPLTPALCLLPLLGIFASSYSEAELAERLGTVCEYLRLLLIPVFIYYLKNDHRLQRGMIISFVAAMSITLVLGVLKVHADFPIGLKYTLGSVFKSHIKTSYFMAMAVFFVGLSIQYSDYLKNSKWLKLGATLLALAMIYYLFFLSLGRIGHITLVLLTGLVAWRLAHWRGLAIGLGCIVLGLFTLYQTSDVFSNRINQLKQDWVYYGQENKLVHSSLGSRLTFYQTSAEIFARHIGLGVGTGGFADAYKTYYESKHKTTLLTDNPHNQFLKVMVEFGILGLLGFIYIIYTQWRASALLAPERRLWVQGCLLTFYVGCFLNSWISDFTESYFFIVAMAVGFASLVRPACAPKSVSLIITTYNWPQALDRVLASVQAQHCTVPLEILIADDGSIDETQQVIKAWQEKLPSKIIHIWQEDNGFRAAKIRNLAARAAQHEYLIFVDGDCILSADFITRHVNLAEPGYFVAGNRILLNPDFSNQVLGGYALWQLNFMDWVKLKYKGYINRWLPMIPLSLGSLRYLSKRTWAGVKTCNLALWRTDFYAVNGFDEQYEGWGFEDSDLAVRLINHGVFHKNGRFNAPVYHIYHQEVSRDAAADNLKALKETVRLGKTLATRGLDQYA